MAPKSTVNHTHPQPKSEALHKILAHASKMFGDPPMVLEAAIGLSGFLQSFDGTTGVRALFADHCDLVRVWRYVHSHPFRLCRQCKQDIYPFKPSALFRLGVPAIEPRY